MKWGGRIGRVLKGSRRVSTFSLNMFLPVALLTTLFAAFNFCNADVNNFTAQTEELGAVRCLDAEDPMWCFVKEAGVGLARALTSDKQITPSTFLTSNSADPWIDLASKSLDMDLTSLTSTEEGRGKKKQKRKYAYVFVALATLAAVILPFKLKAIALMAASALVIGKLALILASVIGLKKLVSKQPDETTHVHYGHRSDAEAQILAYQEQIPQDVPDTKY